MNHQPHDSNDKILSELLSKVPTGSLIHSSNELAGAGQDLYYEFEGPIAIFRPVQIDEIAPVLAILADADVTITPWGGRMSYTGGYLPDSPYVAVDMSRLDAVEWIDLKNRLALVQAGCTWHKLYEALAQHGLRPLSWGPLSGIRATVGGSVSQNAVFWGGGRDGTVAEGVSGLELALATGEIIRTGALAHGHDTPFFRPYGPDLTSLLIGDCGAFGIKTRVLVRLVPTPAASLPASFTLESSKQLLDCMADIARAGLAAQQFGFDPALISIRSRPEGLSRDIKSLVSLMRSAPSLGKGLLDAASVAFSGRRFLNKVQHTLHLMTEGETGVIAEARLKEVQKIVSRYKSREIAATVPRLMQARPFGHLGGIVGPNSERWVPIHVLVPLSKAPAVCAEIEGILAAKNALMDSYKILSGILFSTISTSTTLIEVMLFWPDSVGPLHEDALGAKFASRLTRHPGDAETRGVIDQLRKDLLDCFARHDSAHLQIGRTYPWAKTSDPIGLKLINAALQSADPRGKMNRGVLNLERGPSKRR